jgi:mannose-6-phosphate isomerase class I
MDVVLTLSGVHPRDRLAYWYDVARKVFVDHKCRVATASQYDVTMQQTARGDLGVVNIESLGLGFADVTARTVANGEDDVFFLCRQLEGGATLSQDGREALIKPGDFVLLDAQRSYSCRYTTNWRQIIIKIPHRSLNARLAASSGRRARCTTTWALAALHRDSSE